MERRLILMRHAKSSWKHEGVADHDRPLNGRGRRDAPRIAQALLEAGWGPELVLSSTSTRTRETWERMRPEWAHPVRFLAVPAFYLGALGDIRSALASVEDDIGCVMALGHNPGWEDALSLLAGAHEPMTTANAALLSGGGATWKEALSGGWSLTKLLRPRTLD